MHSASGEREGGSQRRSIGGIRGYALAEVQADNRPTLHRTTRFRSAQEPTALNL
jgi:hypothetical protein